MEIPNHVWYAVNQLPFWQNHGHNANVIGRKMITTDGSEFFHWVFPKELN